MYYKKFNIQLEINVFPADYLKGIPQNFVVSKLTIESEKNLRECENMHNAEVCLASNSTHHHSLFLMICDI